MNYIVITSINKITEAVRAYSDFKDWKVIVVADKKSVYYEYENVEFLTVNKQEKLNFLSYITTPFNHYSRKNIGYLYAISMGAEYIYDTDDDTIPYDNWENRNFECSVSVGGDKYINPFSFFTDKKAWPRGLHLSYINKQNVFDTKHEKTKIGVWQGIIDKDSDFDAIYRLTVDNHIIFEKNNDIAISKDTYAPFNTQSTLWNKKFYSLLYLPITVDFRFTDILRGYVCQRIMWEHGYNLGFHHPNTYQIRNAHDYYQDFLGEIGMYKSIPILVDILDNICLSGVSIEDDLMYVYENLEKQKIVSTSELCSLKNWISDINNIKNNKI